MTAIMPILMFALGLILIIYGSDRFVDNAIRLAKYLCISDIVIGATLVSICTTLPETVVSFGASLHGSPQMALGNAFGSIAFNISIVLSLTIIVSKPGVSNKKDFAKNSFLLVGLFFLIYIMFVCFGQIGFLGSLILLGILIWYLYHNVKKTKEKRKCGGFVAVRKTELFKTIAMLFVGAFFTVIGANFLVESGIIIANVFCVPQSIIGLTMASIGTSLPELMTTVTAIRKNASDLSFGNIIGACILNVLLVLGASGIIFPLVADAAWIKFQIPFVLMLIVIPVFSALIFKKVPRLVGVVNVILYATYLGINFVIT